MALVLTGPNTVMSLDGHDLTPYLLAAPPGGPAVAARFDDRGVLHEVHIDGRVMTPAELRDITNWLEQHQLDPRRVPIESVVGYDPATNEWRFTVYVPSPAGRGIRVDLARNEPVTHVVRRRRVEHWTRPGMDGA